MDIDALRRTAAAVQAKRYKARSAPPSDKQMAQLEKDITARARLGHYTQWFAVYEYPNVAGVIAWLTDQGFYARIDSSYLVVGWELRSEE